MAVSSLDLIQERLLQERESLRLQIERLGNSTQEFGEYDYRADDDAIWGTVRAENVALLRHLKHLLEQVESALTKLSAGVYGLCEDCGMPIPPARLEAIPYASLCIACQERREKTARGLSVRVR
jgi:DnaK suppressor protein